jgi:REP element-mobilizing transposase RayT
MTTAGRACLFGDIRDGELILNEAGVVVESWWYSIPARFPDVTLDAMVAMPNHLHGILSLGTSPTAPYAHKSLSEMFRTRTVRDYGLGVRTRRWAPYDGRLWQPGFYDHIIRSDAALKNVRDYIAGNPAK